MKSRGALLAMLVATAGGPIPCRAQEDVAELQGSTTQVANRLIQTLGTELRSELAKGGPDRAVAVCKSIAPRIAGELSIRNGWQVARVSLKVRNPLLGTPDAWEQATLLEFDRRAAVGEKPDSLEYGAVVDEPQGRFYRYMKAIPVQLLCLTCHGTEATLLWCARASKRSTPTIAPRVTVSGRCAGQYRSSGRSDSEEAPMILRQLFDPGSCTYSYLLVDSDGCAPTCEAEPFSTPGRQEHAA